LNLLKGLRRIFAVIAALVIGLVAVAAIFLYTADFNRYKGLIDAAITDATGRDVVIKGDLTIVMSLPPEFAVTDVTVANATWGSQPLMAHIGQLRLRLRLLPLLKKDIDFSGITLIDTDLLFETGAKGQSNWQFTHQPSSGAGVGVRHMAVEQLQVKNLTVTLRSAGTGSPPAHYMLDSLNLTRPATADSLAVELKGSSNGQAVSLSGKTGPLRNVIEGLRFPLDLSGEFAGATVRLHGEIANALKLEGLELELQAAGSDLAKLGNAVAVKIPQTDGFDLRAQLTGNGHNLTLRKARGSVSRKGNKLAINGEIGNLNALKDIQLAFKGAGGDLAGLGSIVGKTLPKTGPFEVSGKLAGTSKALAVRDLSTTVKYEDSQLVVTGELDDVLQLTGIDLSLQASGKNLGQLGPLFATQLPDLGPFQMQGQLSGSDKLLNLKSFSGTIDQSDFAGWAKVEFGTRPKITAGLESALVDFTRILDQTQDEKTGDKKGEKARASGSRRLLFSKKPLPLDMLAAVDADVAFKAQNIRADDALLELGQLRLVLAAGDLRVEKLEATYKGAKVSANLSLMAGKPSKVALSFLVQGFDLGRFTRETHISQEVEGRVDLAGDLNSEGDSPHRLMANLNGSIGAVIGKGHVPRILDLLASDLAEKVVPLWGHHKESGQLNCAVIQFTNKAGIATSDAFLLDTQVGLVKGDGEINFGTEQLDFLLSPKPKDASLFTLTTKLRVSGSILDPRVKPDIRSLVEKGARALSALVVGPVGLLAPFVRLGARHHHPCDVQELKLRVQKVYELDESAGAS
jgi:uncharacterized protein involved in outer membrane biogenesis